MSKEKIEARDKAAKETEDFFLQLNTHERRLLQRLEEQEEHIAEIEKLKGSLDEVERYCSASSALSHERRIAALENKSGITISHKERIDADKFPMADEHSVCVHSPTGLVLGKKDGDYDLCRYCDKWYLPKKKTKVYNDARKVPGRGEFLTGGPKNPKRWNVGTVAMFQYSNGTALPGLVVENTKLEVGKKYKVWLEVLP